MHLIHTTRTQGINYSGLHPSTSVVESPETHYQVEPPHSGHIHSPRKCQRKESHYDQRSVLQSRSHHPIGSFLARLCGCSWQRGECLGLTCTLFPLSAGRVWVRRAAVCTSWSGLIRPTHTCTHTLHADSPRASCVCLFVCLYPPVQAASPSCSPLCTIFGPGGATAAPCDIFLRL